MKIEGKVALVTGAAQGIGRAISERLLELGAKWVSIIDFDKKHGEETEAEFGRKYSADRVGFICCDVSFYDRLTANERWLPSNEGAIITFSLLFEDAFEETYKRHGQLDIVINNAARGEGPDISWDSVMQVTYLAVVRGVRLAKRYMSTENGGRGGVVINTASMNGLRNSWTPIYGSSKAAVVYLSRSLTEADRDFSEGNMRVGAICPGYVETEGGKGGNALLKPEDKRPQPVPMDTVVNGFMQIIEDDSLNGIVLTSTVAGNLPWSFRSNEEIDAELKFFQA